MKGTIRPILIATAAAVLAAYVTQLLNRRNTVPPEAVT